MSWTNYDITISISKMRTKTQPNVFFPLEFTKRNFKREKLYLSKRSNMDLSHLHPTEINNIAVKQMESGDIDGAIATFTVAVRASKQLMVKSRDEEEDLKTQDGTSDEQKLDNLMRISHPDNDSMDCREEMAQDQCYMYRRAIQVTEDDIEDDYESRIVLSVVILFNLALSNHLSAEMEDDETRKSLKLRKAAKLYEMTYNLHQDASIGLNPLFLLATVNNLGVIYQTMNQQETAQELFRTLLSTILFLTDCGEGKVVSEFGGFFQNVSGFIFSECTAAAA